VGTDPRRAADPEDDYFRRDQGWQDEFRFSATLWTGRESSGDLLDLRAPVSWKL
jgi:hypothetical protein